MPDDLRTRIIAALLSEEDVALMADAVIEELGLRQETTYAWKNGRTYRSGIRYVTKWTNQSPHQISGHAEHLAEDPW